MDLQKTFNEYLEIRLNLDPIAFAPYDWLRIPNSLEFMIYGMFVKEHARELSNSINEFHRLILSLKAWDEVMSNLSSSDKAELIHEFIQTQAITALNLPSVIKSRFIFSITHLCHQANKFVLDNWRDDLPLDSDIWFNEADRCGSSWGKTYISLKVALEKLANSQYRKDTKDFRNKYNHRYSPRIEIGITNFISRTTTPDGAVSYGVGGCQPLKIENIIPVLVDQHGACLKAYQKYQKLVCKHVEAIKMHNQSSEHTSQPPSEVPGKGVSPPF